MSQDRTITPESSQARMTLVEALRYHASLMIAPEVAPKVRALLNDASTVMWAAAEALSTESETTPTTMPVSRYGLRCDTWEMVPDSAGKWVAYGDYEALEQLYIKQTGCCK